MTRSNSRFFYTLLFALYLICVAYLCFGNVGQDIEGFNILLPEEIWGIQIDKCIHFTMFFPFIILGFYAFRGNNQWKTLMLVSLLATCIAFAFEFLQSSINESRTTDPWDFVANITAITTSTVIMAARCLFKADSKNQNP